MEETQNTNNLWVKKIGLEAPKGFKVSNSPITYKGNLQLEFSKGYSLPTIHKQSLWDNAYYNSHVHPNREVIDNITSEDIERWNSEANLEYKGSIDFKNIKNLPKTIQEYGVLNVYTKDNVDSLVHKHSNKELLDSITPGMLQGALLQILKDDGIDAATNENVFSALRTLLEISKNNDYLDNVFLSKIRPDTAKGKIIFEGGAEFGDYINSIHSGRGGSIDSAGNAELESLALRSFLEVPTIRYNELEYIGEEIIIGAGAVLKGVEHLGDDRYRLTLKLEDGQLNPFRPSDLLKGIYNMDEDSNFTGFGTTYVSVSSIDEHDEHEMIVILADESDVVGNRNMPPRKFMHLARIGNFIDKDRQSYISLSAKDRAITQYGGVNAFARKNKQGLNVRAGTITTQWGRAEGLEFIENFENLPITKDSDVLYTDTLLYNKQIKVDYKGIVIKEYIDRGQWFEGMECQVTETTIDEAWHNSEKFRLIDRPISGDAFVTTEKPSRESGDWMLILSIKDDIDSVEEILREALGDGNLRMEITTDDGYIVDNVADITLEARVYAYLNDKTSLVEEWVWTRQSGEWDDTDARDNDILWNANHSGELFNKNTINITGDDITKNTVKFICDAYIDEEYIRQSIEI